MSTHPNVMIQCVLTVDDGMRKTERALLKDFGGDGIYDDCVIVGGADYKVTCMEDSYEDGYQISAEEGQLVLHDYLTYGYGEAMTWDKVEERVESLRAWAESAKEKHKFSYEIRIGANYW
mgnify:CR=1 FL=1